MRMNAAIYMWAVVVHYYRPNGVPTGYIMIQTKHELQKRIDSRGKQISGAQSSTKHNLNGPHRCEHKEKKFMFTGSGTIGSNGAGRRLHGWRAWMQGTRARTHTLSHTQQRTRARVHKYARPCILVCVQQQEILPVCTELCGRCGGRGGSWNDEWLSHQRRDLHGCG